MEDLKNSLISVFKNRITNPLTGTFIISWVIWNWKIFYLTFFVSEKSIITEKIATKIDYILEHCSDICNLLVYPLLSTLFFILLFPFVSVLAYRLQQYFRGLKITIKDRIDNKEVWIIYKRICKEGLYDTYLEVGNKISNNEEFLNKDSYLKIFTNLGLIKYDRPISSEGIGYFYKILPIGEEVLKLALFEKRPVENIGKSIIYIFLRWLRNIKKVNKIDTLTTEELDI